MARWRPYHLVSAAAAASQAAARFRLAESNFSRYSSGSGFRLLHLRPAVSAFCGLQADPAVLQALLSHLLALTG